MSEEKKPKSKRKDPRVECEYEEEIELICPTTGKKIKQVVKITRYKSAGDIKASEKSITEELEEGFDPTWGDIEEIEQSDD